MGEYVENRSVRSGGEATEERRMILGRKRKMYDGDGGEFDSAENSNSAAPSVEKTCRGSMSVRDLEDVDSRCEGSEFGVESSSVSVNGVFSGEASPTSDECGDPEAIIQIPSQKLQQRHVVHVMPSATELEDFLSTAEMYQQKRFVEKYNYDTVMDVPLEGRYQWVRLHP